MGDMATFHAERLSGLGGSDIGAILGLNPWRTPYQVFLEKTGQAEPFTGNLQTRFGSYAEEFVAREYCEQTGRQVQRFNGLLRHPDAPLIGHIDRLVIPEGAKRASYRQEIRTDLGLEAKTASAFASGRDSEWGEAGTDAVPQSYLLQSAAYMALTGCPRWDLAVLFGNQEFRIYHLTRDLELEGYIIEEASRWWRDHVIAGGPPDPSSEAESRQRWPGHQPGKVLPADQNLLRLARALAATKKLVEEWSKEEHAIKDELLPLLADAEMVEDGGRSILTYRANKASQKIDWYKVATELLSRYDADERQAITDVYTTTQPGARVLRLAKDLEKLS
jgi:putative phage-type endonuclease